jgi:hypothetical protein
MLREYPLCEPVNSMVGTQAIPMMNANQGDDEY